MARMFSLEQALPPATITLEFLRALETEMRSRAEKYPFSEFRFSLEDHEGTETFDSVADDGVSLRLKQCQSVQLELYCEKENFLISLDMSKFSGEANLKVHVPGAHAREEALQIAAQIRELVSATNTETAEDRRYRYFSKAMFLPSIKLSVDTVKTIKETIIRVCADYCEVDPGIIKIENEITLKEGVSSHNVTGRQLEAVGFPAGIKSFSITGECVGGRHAAKIEAKFGHRFPDTHLSVMGLGDAAEDFARGAHREIINALQRVRTHHWWLFLGQRFPGTAMLGGMILFFASPIAASEGVLHAELSLPVALCVMLSPFLGYLLPYTQFDTFAIRSRVRLVNWIISGIAAALLGWAFGIFGGLFGE